MFAELISSGAIGFRVSGNCTHGVYPTLSCICGTVPKTGHCRKGVM